MPQEAPGGGSRGKNLLILKLKAKWGGQSVTSPSHIIPRKEPHCPLLRRLGKQKGWPGWVERIENLSPTRVQTLDHPARNNSLYRRYPGPHKPNRSEINE